MSSSTKSKVPASGRARKVTAPARRNNENRTLHPEMREQMIAESAYYRARGRGFMAGDELQDWLAAEDEIDRLLLNQA